MRKSEYLILANLEFHNDGEDFGHPYTQSSTMLCNYYGG